MCDDVERSFALGAFRVFFPGWAMGSLWLVGYDGESMECGER